MGKVAVIGLCGNSLFFSVDRFHEPGQTLSAEACMEEIGGKGFNQAAAAARMGAETVFLAAVGDDADGEKCRLAALSCGVTPMLAVKKGERTAIACILTDAAGENRVTVYRGAALTAKDVAAFEPAIAASDILLLQHEVPPEVNEAAALLAKKHGVRVILNPAPAREISPALAETLYLVTPNGQEAPCVEHLSGCNRIVTLGADGCNLNGEHLAPMAVTPVDTTGAGDTFTGTLAAFLAQGLSLSEACRRAICAAGLSVTKPGVLNAIPTKTELERKLAEC